MKVRDVYGHPRNCKLRISDSGFCNSVEERHQQVQVAEGLHKHNGNNSYRQDLPLPLSLHCP